MMMTTGINRTGQSISNGPAVTQAAANGDSPNGWVFEYIGGRERRDGKAHWPDVLTVAVDRREALRIIQVLA